MCVYVLLLVVVIIITYIEDESIDINTLDSSQLEIIYPNEQDPHIRVLWVGVREKYYANNESAILMDYKF